MSAMNIFKKALRAGRLYHQGNILNAHPDLFLEITKMGEEDIKLLSPDIKMRLIKEGLLLGILSKDKDRRVRGEAYRHPHFDFTKHTLDGGIMDYELAVALARRSLLLETTVFALDQDEKEILIEEGKCLESLIFDEDTEIAILALSHGKLDLSEIDSEDLVVLAQTTHEPAIRSLIEDEILPLKHGSEPEM